MSKFNQLFTLAGKSVGKKATLSFKSDGEGTITLTMEGTLKSFDAAGFTTLAKAVGGTIKGKGDIIDAIGAFSGKMPPELAEGFAKAMISPAADGGEAPAEAAPKPVKPNGK